MKYKKKSKPPSHPNPHPLTTHLLTTINNHQHQQVLTSREFKVAGAIGPCSSLRKMGGNVAETAIGEGGTNAWSMGGMYTFACSFLYVYCVVWGEREKSYPTHFSLTPFSPPPPPFPLPPNQPTNQPIAQGSTPP